MVLHATTSHFLPDIRRIRRVCCHRHGNSGDIMVRWLLVASFVVAASAASAQGPFPFMDMRGTPEDQKACRPDAVRLCKHLMKYNDAMVILRCFQQNRTKLSAPCRGVLQKYGQL
jgi:hypothetical protein